MKLKINEYTDKNNNQHKQYKIVKLNEFGEGISVNQEVKGRFVFEPNVRDVAVENKTFKSVSAIIEWHNLESFAPHNVELNEYDNIQVSLPSGVASDLENREWKNQDFTLVLEPFTDKKGVQKTKWKISCPNFITPEQNVKPANTVPDTTSTLPNLNANDVAITVEQNEVIEAIMSNPPYLEHSKKSLPHFKEAYDKAATALQKSVLTKDEVVYKEFMNRTKQA